MHSTKSLKQLSPPNLIHRLFSAAQREFSSDCSREPQQHLNDAALSTPSTPSSHSISRRQSHEGRSLSDTLVVSVEEQILDETYEHHSRTFHMVLLDPNYRVFVSRQGHGSLIYRIAHQTLVVVGDPLCSHDRMRLVLDDLRHFRRPRRLRLAFMGVSDSFLAYARSQRWTSFRFGCERVVNPLTNDVLDNKAGKRMLSQNRQLLDPERGGIRLDIYAPGITGINPPLEKTLHHLYTSWCRTKQERGGRGGGNNNNTQAFITAYDIFAQRTKTAFLFAIGPDNNLCGMAMLRQLGAEAGFHIDPCIAATDAPRGTTDLLMITAMQVLRRAGISYLSLGAEPCVALAGGRGRDGKDGKDGKDCKDDSNTCSRSRIRSQWVPLGERLANAAYRRVTDLEKVSGKKSYNDKFKPDPLLESGLHVVFPRTTLPIQEALAIMKVAHVRPKHMFS
ncbi:hypothetical protein E4U43_005693 [Claviceps pusilla]|uniref:Phosphatidylglycerol lysyltransferase C-terminal domain-containing protein n=1 Tax=Claviceps pusilla TaxID=123648 RepID=A0A9P7N3V2_9HYPO|nr:hypothetical protein E4U43_005693 [Claviceps pusilla]